MRRGWADHPPGRDVDGRPRQRGRIAPTRRPRSADRQAGSGVALLAARIEGGADTPAIAFTHIQPAEPTTVGYRLAQYGQDLLADLGELRRVRDNVRGKGLKGAVGTSASYTQLLDGTG
ncbi:MAG: lyase family protein [Caldilineaceae bacterium]